MAGMSHRKPSPRPSTGRLDNVENKKRWRGAISSQPQIGGLIEDTLERRLPPDEKTGLARAMRVEPQSGFARVLIFDRRRSGQCSRHAPGAIAMSLATLNGSGRAPRPLASRRRTSRVGSHHRAALLWAIRPVQESEVALIERKALLGRWSRQSPTFSSIATRRKRRDKFERQEVGDVGRPTIALSWPSFY